VYNWNDIIQVAAKSGHIDIVELMIDKGADELEPALSLAARNDHADIVALLETIIKGVKTISISI